MFDERILSLFSGFGIEIEYMVVNRQSLNICPIADHLLYDLDAGQQCWIEANELCYSNELALHLIELKTNGPCLDLAALPQIFNRHINNLNQKLMVDDAMLLPSGAHPWMDPKNELILWPHEGNEVYTTYNEIFNCRSHGWCNVQSTHLNLPFANDTEFAKLHAAIRLLLPIIPTLTASSPIINLQSSGYLDSRLLYYAENQKRFPTIAGQIIPENFTSKKQYQTELLEKLYQVIAPHDRQCILRNEWLNSRGAIARFSRNTIEIRVMDTQESPLADLAIAAFIVAILKNLVDETWQDYHHQIKLQTEQLRKIYLGAIKDGTNYQITDRKFLEAFGCNYRECTAKQFWNDLFIAINQSPHVIDNIFIAPLNKIFTHGNLSERILSAVAGDFSKKNVACVYKKLATCLEKNLSFGG